METYAKKQMKQMNSLRFQSMPVTPWSVKTNKKKTYSVSSTRRVHPVYRSITR